jgi:hypothetical protein
MEGLSNSVSTVIQLCKLINLSTPEDEHSKFSETSVRTSATQYKVSEDIYNWYRRESIPEDIVLRTLTVTLYGNAQ